MTVEAQSLHAFAFKLMWFAPYASCSRYRDWSGNVRYDMEPLLSVVSGTFTRKMSRPLHGAHMKHCPKCGGDLKAIAAIMETGAIRKILTHLGLPDKPPEISPARLSPQMSF